MSLLSLRGLGHTYPNGTAAAVGLDLDLEAGELVGLIGPDGAGKTTLFRMLMGLLPPTTGTLSRGVSPSGVGYVPQAFSLAPDLTVAENLALQARFYGVRDPGPRMGRLLEAVGLGPFGDRLSGALSGGMKQKLALCAALLPEPRLLLLDEPTTGVDPVSRREFWRMLHGVHASGVAILFSTPYMDEAEYAHRMILMASGRFLAQGTLASFQAGLGGLVLEARVEPGASRAVRRALCALAPLDCFAEGDTVRARFQDQAPGPLLAAVAALPGVASVQPSRPTLEDVFLHALAEAGHG